MERSLYNGVLAGLGLDGKSFFYHNPLASDGSHHRLTGPGGVRAALRTWLAWFFPFGLPLFFEFQSNCDSPLRLQRS